MFQSEETGLWEGWFFGYGNYVAASKLTCLSVLGHSIVLKPFLLHNTTARYSAGQSLVIVMGGIVGQRWSWTVF